MGSGAPSTHSTLYASQDSIHYISFPSLIIEMEIKLVALSRPSSCGKTTIAYLLKHVFPNVIYILRGYDFYKEFDEIPTVNGYLDSNGPGTIDYVLYA